MKKHLIKSEKINVLMVGPYPPPYGGIAVVVRDILNSPLKYCVNLKLLRKKPLQNNSFIDHILRFSLDISNLMKDLIEKPIDIVHIHTSYDGGWIKHSVYAIISKIFGCKVILHLHAYSKKCNDQFPKIWLKRYIFPPQFIFKIVDGIITLSDNDSEKIVKSCVSCPVITIRNGVILKNFDTYSSHDKSKDSLNLIYLGNIERRKGIFVLISVLPKLIEKLNINVVIAGEGKDYSEVLKWYQSLDKSHKQHIHVVGRVTEDEKIELLCNSDIFLLQSDNEGMPISILEAMASGCAIITTPVGSIPDIIKNRINGLIIQPNNVDELRSSIFELYSNRNLLSNLQRKNQDDIKKYSWELQSINIEKFYRIVLEDKND